MATVAISPPGSTTESKRFFWQDPFGLLLFLLLFGIMASNFEIGGLAGVLKSIRWGLLTLATLAGTRYISDALSFGLTQVHKALLALIVLGVLSCAYSMMPWYSFQRIGSFIMLWTALFLGAWGWLSRPGNLKLGVGMLFGLLWITSAIGVFDILTGSSGAHGRAEGAFNRATSAGTFAAVTLPIILWKIRYSKDLMRTMAIGLLLVQAYVLVFSAARGALLAGVVGILAIIWKNYRRYGPLATGTVVFVGVALLVVKGLDVLPERIVRSESLSTLTGRTDRWKAGWFVYKKNPWLGYGHGVERYCVSTDPEAIDYFYSITDGSSLAQRMRLAVANGILFEHTVHNEYLARLLEEGVAGLAVFIWFWVVLLWGIVRALFRPNNPLADLVRCLYVSVWVVFVDSFLHAWMFAVGFGLNPVLWYFIVLTLSADWQLMRYERAQRISQQSPSVAGTLPAGRLQAGAA